MEGYILILGLFCGCGGLDLGFQQAGYPTALAYDLRKDSVASWNHNRTTGRAFVRDIRRLNLKQMDSDFGTEFAPTGVIGGPPCQGFSRANSSSSDEDPRNALVKVHFDIALALHRRSPLHFIVMENVREVESACDGRIIRTLTLRLRRYNFSVGTAVINAASYGVPQQRHRYLIVALNKEIFGDSSWCPPPATTLMGQETTVYEAIGTLPEPTVFRRGLTREQIGFHPNHWCMAPKSNKFSSGILKPGYSAKRSFKALSWNKPSITVSYGNREVHIHPNCMRRLSVFEAMLLQGFPRDYSLLGSMSSQINQVSEAVPPPLAKVVASSISELSHRSTPLRQVA